LCETAIPRSFGRMLKWISFRDRSRRSQAQIVRRVCERLEKTYGRPRLGNPRSPLDDLFFILLSNRTAPMKARATYEALRKRYPRWATVADASVNEMRKIMAPAGLAAKRAAQMRGMARRLRSDFGRVTLGPLGTSPDDEVLAYMRTLPGVSTKVAYCVMMYAMGRQVLPVDVHVHRISQRLGWIGAESARNAHDLLANLVPAHRRYAFHVGCVLHGRAVCRPQEPRCSECVIGEYCDSLRRRRCPWLA